MWMLVLFDHPMKNPGERRSYRELLDSLKALVFEQRQLSVYLRQCSTFGQADSLAKRVQRAAKRSSGTVDIVILTDRQYRRVSSLSGGRRITKESNEFVFF